MRGKLWTFIRPVKEGAVIRFLNSSGETGRSDMYGLGFFV